jgi:hypothetical protein
MSVHKPVVPLPVWRDALTDTEDSIREWPFLSSRHGRSCIQRDAPIGTSLGLHVPLSGVNDDH